MRIRDFRFFEPGMAIVVCPRYQSEHQPLVIARAVVLRVAGDELVGDGPWQRRTIGGRVTIRPLDRQHARWTHAINLVPAGYCPQCDQLAHQGPSGIPSCPRCQQPAPHLPSEDRLLRTYPAGDAFWPRLVRRYLAAEGRRTIQEIRRELHAERDEALREAIKASGIGKIEIGNDIRLQDELVTAAELGDLVRFKSAWQAAQPFGDDRVPDPQGANDDVTRWLRAQVERHEQRRHSA